MVISRGGRVVLSLALSLGLLGVCFLPVFAQEPNPFGTLDTAQMASAMSSFIGYFSGAIAIIVGVFAAVIVVKGVRSIFGGGG